MRAFLVFIKSRIFAFIRKIALFLILLVMANIYGITAKSWMSKLLVFLLAYLSIYAFNDLLDYEQDKKRKKLRPSKILAKGEISFKDMLLIGSSLLALSAAMSSIFLSRYEIFILFTIVLIGILRSLSDNLLERTFSLFILELMNLHLFSVFLGLGSASLIVNLLVSLYYSINYYFYKQYEKRQSVIKYYDYLLIVSVIISLLLPYNLIFRTYLAISSAILIMSWKKSLKKASHSPVIVGGVLFFVISGIFLAI